MNEREEEIQYLMREMGYDHAIAEAHLSDDDLWLLQPALRAPAVDAEAAQGYQQAAQTLRRLAEVFDGPLWALLLDASERATELSERAKKRAKEDS